MPYEDKRTNDSLSKLYIKELILNLHQSPGLNVVFVSTERPGIQYLDDTFFEEHLVGATIVGEDTGCISR